MSYVLIIASEVTEMFPIFQSLRKQQVLTLQLLLTSGVWRFEIWYIGIHIEKERVVSVFSVE
jgi:hypothetical protein